MCEQDSCGLRDKLSNSDEVTLPDDLSLSDSDPEEEPASVPFDPEVIDLSDSDDDDEEEDDDGLRVCGAQGGRPPSSAPPGGGETQSPFSLKGGSSDFSSRSRSIFDSLDSAAKRTSSQLGQDNVIDGVFARPPPPPPLASGKKQPGVERAGQPPQSGGGGAGGQKGGRGGGVPDYLVHPERWTCYSLEDVAETSDRQNSAVAQQYLHSLQQRKDREASGPEPAPFVPTFNQGQTADGGGSQHKIIFSKPSRAARDPAAADPKAAGGTERGKGLRHLEEEEDEEEEEEEGVRLEATDKGMDGSKEMKKAQEREGGVGHTEPEGEKEEEDGKTAAVQPPKVEQRKRKWGKQGRGDAVEEEEKESNKHHVNPGFVSFRKINRKNYRRTSEHEED